MQAQSQVTCPQQSLMHIMRASEFYGGQAVYKDIVEFAGQVPGIDYGAYYSDIRSALTDAITNVVQNDADIDDRDPECTGYRRV